MQRLFAGVSGFFTNQKKSILTLVKIDRVFGCSGECKDNGLFATERQASKNKKDLQQDASSRNYVSSGFGQSHQDVVDNHDHSVMAQTLFNTRKQIHFHIRSDNWTAVTHINKLGEPDLPSWC